MTFLRLLLQTAACLSFPPVMLQHSHFLKAIGTLQRSRSGPSQTPPPPLPKRTRVPPSIHM